MKNKTSYSPLTEFLQQIIEKNKEKSTISLDSLIKELSDRGYPTLIFVISIAFSFPISIPGLSSPFGLILCSLGVWMVLGKKLWFPKWLLAKQIPMKNFSKIVHYTTALFKKIEILIHPRLCFLCKKPSSMRVHGTIVIIQGFLLALPLPIPLTNIVASLPLLFLSIGLLEDDGVFVIIGYILTFMSLTGFFLLFREINYLTAIL